MKIIRDLLSTEQISDPAIRKLVQQRIDDLGGDKFDAAVLGYFLIVESGESIDAITTQMGFPVLANRVTGIKFGEPGFAPSFEFVEAIGNCYDIVFVVDDSGFGVELFVPVAEGVPAELLAMCQRYATPEQI
jgi:hypothetical protein